MLTTAGNVLPGDLYTILNSGQPSGVIALETAGAPNGSTALQLLFQSPLTDAGGAFPLS
jgi:hypothetical protein